MYRFEQVRIDSYRGWPSAHMTPLELAGAGFYYTKIDDRCKCFACGLEVVRWEVSDNAMDEHSKWSKNCPFINGEPIGNVPIGADPLTIDGVGIDVCGLYKEGVYCYKKHPLTSECRHFRNCGYCQLLLTRTTCDCLQKCNHMIDCKYCKVHHE